MPPTNYGPIVTNLLCTVTGASVGEYAGEKTHRMHPSICEISPELFFPKGGELNLSKLEEVAVLVGAWLADNINLEHTDGVIWPCDLADAVSAVNETTGTELCPPIVTLLRGASLRLGDKPAVADEAEEAVA